jgi:hypothetical protein
MMLTGLTGEKDEEEDDLRRIGGLLVEQYNDLQSGHHLPSTLMGCPRLHALL